MTVFGRLFKARDKPRNSLNGSGYSFFFGSTASGKAVNERSAMQMSAVYACVRILARPEVSLPLHFYQLRAARKRRSAIRSTTCSIRFLREARLPARART